MSDPDFNDLFDRVLEYECDSLNRLPVVGAGLLAGDGAGEVDVSDERRPSMSSDDYVC